jgi:hypothetical protein
MPYGNLSVVVAVSRRAIRFPAVVFWIAFIGVPTGLLSSLVFQLGMADSAIPGLTTFFGQHQCTQMIQFGFSLSALGMLFVLYYAHVFVTHSFRSSWFRFLSDLSGISSIVLLLIVVSGVLDRGSLGHVSVRIAYLQSSAIFHRCIDWVAQKDHAIVRTWFGQHWISLILPAVIAIFFVAGDRLKGGLFIGSVIEILGLLYVHLRYLSAGFILLGARFFPLQRRRDPAFAHLSLSDEL